MEFLNNLQQLQLSFQVTASSSDHFGFQHQGNTQNQANFTHPSSFC